MTKNEQQRLKNLARSQHGQAPTVAATTPKAPGALSERKGHIDRTLAMTRTSTASMGKFDRMLEGEKKPRGVKRKVPHTVPRPSPTFLTLLFFYLFSLNRRKGRSKRKKARI